MQPTKDTLCPIPGTTEHTRFLALFFTFHQHHSKEQRKWKEEKCQSWSLSPGTNQTWELVMQILCYIPSLPSAICSHLHLLCILGNQQCSSMQHVIPFCFPLLIKPSPYHIFSICLRWQPHFCLSANSSNSTAISGNQMTQVRKWTPNVRGCCWFILQRLTVNLI